MKELYQKLPETPGVYIMKNATEDVLYVGKAGNLRRRVSSYFQKAHDSRIEKLVNEIKKIDYKKTDTAIEALILEAKLIKQHEPPFNIREKDNKSFLYVEVTNDKFPRVILVRGKSKAEGKRFGPFTSSSSIRIALKIIRRIFPFATHPMPDHNKPLKACFDYQIGLCPGTCVNAVTKEEYEKNIKNLTLFFEGKKQKILKSLTKEMKSASKALDFETAEKLRRKIFALQHIQDVALIQDGELRIQDGGGRNERIEGYDISNISGISAVGSMVVFLGAEPAKSEYRKFRIKTVHQADDTGMLREMLSRRFRREKLGGGWPLPDLILIDGGVGQVHAAIKVLREVGLKIPVVGIAKGAERKRNDLIGIKPKWIDLNTLIRVRDEAHRFAVKYHKEVRGREFFSKKRKA